VRGSSAAHCRVRRLLGRVVDRMNDMECELLITQDEAGGPARRCRSSGTPTRPWRRRP
jgi:hypothetical protein